jgi:Leucine-rich repeat (LRR) protein
MVMRTGWLLALSLTALAGPADQALARWTILEGGRVAIGGRVYSDVAELPAGDYQLEMVDWVAVNAVPEDLERTTGLRALRELRLPGPLWNRNADGGKDLSQMLRFLAPVTTLEKLTFSDHFLDRIRFRDAGLDAIQGLSGLRELALRQAEVKGPGLRHFANLESLDITLCPLADLGPVAGMRQLRRLWAGDTFISNLQPLSGLTALEDLDLHGTGIRDESVRALGGLRALRRLDLQGTQLTDAAVETLAGLRELEWLNLYRTQISNAGLMRLRELRKLRHLDIRYTRVTASGYEALRAALPGARIQFAGGSGRAVSALPPPAGGDAPALAAWIGKLGGKVRLADGFVSLRGIPLTDAAVAALAAMPGLRILDLEATEIGDRAAATLKAAAALEELTLNSTQVSDAGVAELAALPGLRRLALNNTYANGSGFANWPAESVLEELSLLGTAAGDDALAGIGKLRRLRRLVLAESDVTGSGLAALAELPLEELDLAAADVGDDAPLHRFPALRRLRLRDTRISDALLLEKLSALRQLEHLDLARTRISNKGMDGLSRLPALRSLDISYAEVDDAGLAILGRLREIESINLDSTHVSDAALPTLTAWPKLADINLYHSLVSEPGAAALRKAKPAARVTWDKEAAMPHRRRA